MNRTRVLLLGVLAVMGVAGSVWHASRPAPAQVADPVSEPLPEHDASGEPDEPPDELETLEEFEESILLNQAVAVADPSQVPAQAEPRHLVESNVSAITGHNIREMVDGNMALALEGDIHAAYFLPKAYQRCQYIPQDQRRLEKAVQRIENRASRAQASSQDGTWSFRDSRSHLRITHETNIPSTLDAWYDSCNDVRAIFGPELRTQLDWMAEQGHVVARYLYATWPVEKNDPALAFEHLVDWEVKALDYSMQNLVAGEPLGFLAFAQSYQSALFTRTDREMTFGFSHAAINCGLPIENVQQYVDTYLRRMDILNKTAFQARMEYARAVSDSLMGFCRN